MFNYPVVFGNTVAKRNAARDEEIRKAIAQSATNLRAAADALEALAKNVADPSLWGSADDMGTIVGRGDWVAREVMGVKRHTLAYFEENSTKAMLLAAQYELDEQPAQD